MEQEFYDYRTMCEKTINYTSLSKEDYRQLVNSMAYNILKKYNLQGDVDISFEKMKWLGLGWDDEIWLNKRYLKKKIINPFSIINTYNTICHEVAHVIDGRQNETLPKEEQRTFFTIQHIAAIKSLSWVNPLKFAVNEFYQEMVYCGSRSEAFARLFAMIETKEFVKDMCSMAKTKYKLNLGQPKGIKQRFVEKNLSALYKGYAQFIEIDEKFNIGYGKARKIFEKGVKKDYVKASLKLLKNKKTRFVYKKLSRKDLSSLLVFPELYDDKLAGEFSDYFKKVGDLETCKRIEDIKFTMAQKRDKIKNGIVKSFQPENTNKFIYDKVLPQHSKKNENNLNF